MKILKSSKFWKRKKWFLMAETLRKHMGWSMRYDVLEEHEPINMDGLYN